MTARELVSLGIADDVVPEAPGGAHTNPNAAAAALKEALVHSLAALAMLPGQALIEHRYARFRAFGEYLESSDVSDRDEAAA